MEGTMFHKVKDIFNSGFITPLHETINIFPDSMIFGSILMYIITNNISFGIFVVFLLEALLSSKLIHNIYEGVYGKLPNITQDDLKCISGYKTQRIEVERILTSPTYPTLPVLMFSAISTYIASAMLSFKETMDIMSKEWSVRYKVSVILTSLLFSIFVLHRYFKCTSMTEIIFAIIFGFAIGLGGYFINRSVFGIEGINLLGLPLLVDRESQKKSIYACAPEI